MRLNTVQISLPLSADMATLLRVSLVAALSTMVTCYNNAKFDIHNGNLTRIQDIDGRCKNPCISEGLRLGIEAIIVGRNLTSKECVCEFFNKTTWDAADMTSNIPDFAIGLTMRTIIMEAQVCVPLIIRKSKQIHLWLAYIVLTIIGKCIFNMLTVFGSADPELASFWTLDSFY